jgi:hypothetical protein
MVSTLATRSAQLAVVALAVVGAVLGWRAWGGEDDRAEPTPATPISATARIVPPVAAFGEPVFAEVDVAVDRTLVDPKTIRLDVEFDPYERFGPVEVERRESESVGFVRFRYALRCLREGCQPVGERSTFEFEIGRVLYRFRNQPGGALEILDWPTFEVTGRVGADGLERARWRADSTTLPAVTYRTGPTATAIGGFAVALAALAAAVLLAGRPGRRSGAVDGEEAFVQLTPLERALQLAREASLNGSGDPRRALERVARELAAAGKPALALRARTLAWSPRQASAEQVDELARGAAETEAEATEEPS